jgi:mRNA-degrading endonuclease RelE of RelBE toxin-antitoxin system
VAKYYVALVSTSRNSSNPRPSSCKTLVGGASERRIRVGDYRVVYTIDDGTVDTGVAAIIG